ncbi:histone-lysine N-methyltransferase SETMAR [Trichonephila clavipes]|nr:histone-lysine N-methyltransferase SETMAR [Trichonephila clavipes]
MQFCFRRFRSGIFDVKVARRPSSKKITEIVEVDRNIRSRSITQELNILHKTVLSHLRKVGFKKKLDVWVSHHQKNMIDRISICEALAKRKKSTHFLSGWRLGMRNESHTAILCENDRGQSAGQTLNSDIYCQQLDCLKLVTDQKRPELAKRRGVVFHQDKASAHTAVVTHQKHWELDWKVLMHPPYSPNLEPNDFTTFFSHCKTSRVISNWDQEKIVKIDY